RRDSRGAVGWPRHRVRHGYRIPPRCPRGAVRGRYVGPGPAYRTTRPGGRVPGSHRAGNAGGGTAVTAFTKLAGVQTKTTLREPAAAFFMLAFGPLFALIMGAVLDNGPQGEFDSSLPGFAGIVVAITSFVLLPIDIVSQRDNGA